MDDVLWHIEQDYECWVRRDVCQIITGEYIPSGPGFTQSGNWQHPAAWTQEHRALPPNVTPWDYCIEHNAGFIRNMDGTPDLRRPAGWHLEDGGILCKYGSGLNPMLQQAVREGYDPIYLVGADIGYQARPDAGDLDGNHFSPHYHQGIRDVSPERADIDNATQIDMHSHAKAYADKNNIQILNATLGGELEVYPRVDFHSLF